MLRLVHIINPVKIAESSDLYIAQPITFRSMYNAKEFSNFEIIQLTTQFDEDKEIIPNHLLQTKNLTRSILDKQDFHNKKKLPFIQDILDRAYNHSKIGDYIIYTNVDIALMPYFYDFIDTQIRGGFDAFVINRRTISNEFSSPEDLIKMYSQIGKVHPGFDCFVFKREYFKKFNLGEACIGANWIGRVLISNLIGTSEKFKIFDQEHLTFHIGDDGEWLDGKYSELDLHNKHEAENVISYWLKQAIDENKKEQLKLFLHHMHDWIDPYSSKKKKSVSFKVKVKRKLLSLLK